MGAWLRRIRGRGPHGGCRVKHAPGPWEVGSTIESGTQAIIHDGDSVLAILTTIPPNPANARLIAAAPDLLEALIWMVENDETFEGDTPLPDHHGATWNEINAYWIAGLNRARAAIAKATGEGE